VSVIAPSVATALPLTPFRYEAQAQRHCPGDPVVWLDFRKETYYLKRQKRYGRGSTGSFGVRMSGAKDPAWPIDFDDIGFPQVGRRVPPEQLPRSLGNGLQRDRRGDMAMADDLFCLRTWHVRDSIGVRTQVAVFGTSKWL
jgi:hypothetical protein